MKIKTKVNVTKEIDIEIKTPYFCRSENGLVFCKVLNKQGHCIIISAYDFATRIEFSEMLYDNLIFAEGNAEIEESEFNEAFESAMNILKNK